LSGAAAALFAVVSMLVSAPAGANDASFYGDGATVFAVKEERVSMEREDITIRHDPKGGRRRGEPRSNAAAQARDLW